MAPEARDYGTKDDSTLVPGSLTVYRHFQADAASGRLYPMNFNFKQRGVSYAYLPNGGRMGEHTYEPPGFMKPKPEVYEALCTRYEQYYWNIDGRVVGYEPAHASPDKSCTCGFYAHYDPETDFYPSQRWGRAYALLSGVQYAKDMVIVRAACEVSGTVVMGRLGVRAQKMKIVGLCVDWSKQIVMRRDYGYGDVGGYQGWRVDPFRAGFYDEYYEAYPEPAGLREDESELAERGTRRIADRYGVTWYQSPEDMVEAHPKADIEALGVDTTPRPNPMVQGISFAKAVSGMTATLNAQMSAYVQSLQQARSGLDAISKAFGMTVHADGTVAFYDKPKSKQQKKRPIKKVGNEVARRAIEAKQNKSAPPGTGIDRRKRKL